MAVGGCRLWPYASRRDALDDALLLSVAMTHKAALAELPHGGGKSVIALNPGQQLCRNNDVQQCSISATSPRPLAAHTESVRAMARQPTTCRSRRNVRTVRTASQRAMEEAVTLPSRPPSVWSRPSEQRMATSSGTRLRPDDGSRSWGSVRSITHCPSARGRRRETGRHEYR